jgi:hypothetical protein
LKISEHILLKCDIEVFFQIFYTLTFVLKLCDNNSHKMKMYLFSACKSRTIS